MDWFDKYQFEAKNANDLLAENIKLKKIIEKMKKSKRIELTENTIKYLAKKAIDEGTSFKPYVESILESLASTQVGRKKEK
jgi:geranylgeranyl pyrophosphate synthase